LQIWRYSIGGGISIEGCGRPGVLGAGVGSTPGVGGWSGGLAVGAFVGADEGSGLCPGGPQAAMAIARSSTSTAPVRIFTGRS